MGKMGKGFFTAESAKLAEKKRKSTKILDGIYFVSRGWYLVSRGWTAKWLNGETVKSGQENGGASAALPGWK